MKPSVVSVLVRGVFPEQLLFHSAAGSEQMLFHSAAGSEQLLFHSAAGSEQLLFHSAAGSERNSAVARSYIRSITKYAIL